MKIRTFLFCVALLLGAAPSVVMAHAIVVESAPAVGAVMNGKDFTATLRFNSRIDHERSRLSLAEGDQPFQPIEVVNSADEAPDLLESKALTLKPGSYRLRWQVLAVDGHITRGDIPFTVQADQ